MIRRLRASLDGFIRIVNRAVPSRITAGDLWARIAPLRRFVAACALDEADALDAPRREEKLAALDDFLAAALRRGRSDWAGSAVAVEAPIEPSAGGEEPAATAPLSGARRLGRWFIVRMRNFVPPGQPFEDALRERFLTAMAGGDERYFMLDNLMDLERGFLRYRRQKPGFEYHAAFTRDRLRHWDAFFAPADRERPLAERYLRHFFPHFLGDLFVKNGAELRLGEEPLFSPREAVAVTRCLNGLVRYRNPRSLLQRIIPPLKTAVLALILLWQGAALALDLGLSVVSLFRNNHYYSLPAFSRLVASGDTPLARRAARIHAMNAGAGLDNYRITGAGPAAVMDCRIEKNAVPAVELNYDAYRRLRVQDQNGLTIVAVDHRALAALRTVDAAAYRRLVDAVIIPTRFERLTSLVDSFAGTSLYEPLVAGNERLHRDLATRVARTPAPLRWLHETPGLPAVVTLVYRKPASQKWIPLDEAPRRMIDALTLLEDRRIRNRLFPLPHRGNDLVVIVPQAGKKILERLLGLGSSLARSAGLRSGAAWLELKGRDFRRAYDRHERGGSSLSNQLMEMLYTRYLLNIDTERSFADRQIVQKTFELPASAMVHWFWSRDEIIEAYINEIYGGHLHDDIRGFRSQAEMYFSRSLSELNLREQMMLVAAIKKPSYIKDYALWLKAGEVMALEERGASRAALAEWERDNEVYGVTRRNATVLRRDKERAERWMERRMATVYAMMRSGGFIDDDELHRARKKDALRFDFDPGVASPEVRLAANIRNELELELGPGRADSGVVLVSTIDPAMQRSLQKVIDRNSRLVEVDPEFRIEGQPGAVFVEGGGRIVLAHEKSGEAAPRVVNRVLADVGGRSGEASAWDWVSQANRSLGSSLKPLLDLYFLLMGYNLNDSLKNTPVSYFTYTLEQRRVYDNYVHRYPDRVKDAAEIEKNWLWSPKNYQQYTGEWVTVRESLARSVNSIHVQIQEMVTPAVFARLLNETMSVRRDGDRHRAYRSLILGGSAGEQRYDRFLQAYSIIPNRGVVQRHTLIDTAVLTDGTVLRPDYRPVKVPVLGAFGRERVEAATLLINEALREVVKNGTMRGMEGIGAGKTGTSNELRDDLATVHFSHNGNCYIAGLRLGNTRNYSLGRAADRLAVPVLRSMVNAAFNPAGHLKGEEYDDLMKKMLSRHSQIVNREGAWYLKGSETRPRRLVVEEIQERERREHLAEANRYYDGHDWHEAAEAYEEYLALAGAFDSSAPTFERIVHCYVKIGNLKRVEQLVERFSPRGSASAVARAIGKKYDITLSVNRDFYFSDGRILARRTSETRENRKKKRDGRENGRKKKLIDYADRFVDGVRKKGAEKPRPAPEPPSPGPPPAPQPPVPKAPESDPTPGES